MTLQAGIIMRCRLINVKLFITIISIIVAAILVAMVWMSCSVRATTALELVRAGATLGFRGYSPDNPSFWDMARQQFSGVACRVMGLQRGTALASSAFGISHIQMSADRVDQACLKRIAIFVEVVELDLSGCEIAEGNLAPIGDLQSLRFLNIGHCNIADEDLEPVARLAHLRWLNLSGTAVIGSAFESLEWKSRNSLERLMLSDSKMTWYYLHTLTQFQSLDYLDLNWCDLDADFQKHEATADQRVFEIPVFSKLRVLKCLGNPFGNVKEEFLLRQSKLIRHD